MDKIIGLELTSHSVSLVCLEHRHDGWNIRKCGWFKVEPNETSVSKIGSDLRNLFRGISLFDTKIVTTVDNPFLLVRKFIFPRMNHEELREAVKWRLKDHLVYPIDEALFDFKVVGKMEDPRIKQLTVFVAAIPKQAVMRQIDILKAAGVMPSAITIAPLAFENLLSHWKSMKNEDVATLNIGLDTTIMNIYRNKKLEFTRVIMCRLERLPAELRLSLNYFLEESHGSKVENMIIFGEHKQSKIIEKILKENLQLSVMEIDPLKDIDIFSREHSFRSAKGFTSNQQIAVALGAALGSDKGINLVPWELKQQIKSYLLDAGARFLVTLISFGFLFFYLNLQFLTEGYKERVIAAQAELDSLLPLVKEIEPLESLNKAVSSRIGLVNLLLARRRVWSGVLRQISQILPENITLSTISVDKWSVELSGVVASYDQSPENILSNFIVDLDKGIFNKIVLVNARRHEDKGVLDFGVNAKLDF